MVINESSFIADALILLMGAFDISMSKYKISAKEAIDKILEFLS